MIRKWNLLQQRQILCGVCDQYVLIVCVNLRIIRKCPKHNQNARIALEEEAAVVYKKETFQGASQKQFIKQLIDKHGNDYKAMARDIKLNIYISILKLSLKKKCEKYLRELPTSS